MKLFQYIIPLLTGCSALTHHGHAFAHVKRDNPSNSSNVTGNSTQSCMYPSQEYIANAWSYLISGNELEFTSYFEPVLNWTVMGTHPLAGNFEKLSLFILNSNERLYASLRTAPKYTLINIVGGCDEAWSVQETLTEATAINGRPLDEVAIWATRWNTEGKVVQVRSYVDSWATAMIIHENEDWSNATFRTNRTTYLPGPNLNASVLLESV